MLTLGVVFVLLATAGWTAVQSRPAAPSARDAALLDWSSATVAGRSVPAPDAPAFEIRGFFDSLTERQRTRLAERHPMVVGNLDGAPLELRYRANRIALRDMIDTERERTEDARLSPTGQHDAGRRMNRFRSMSKAGRQILAFDPTGRGRAAEVFGDLRRAERVVVVVPGVDTDLLTFQRTALRYTAPVGMAQAVYDRGRTLAPDVRTAVIAWADYTTPRGVSMDAATGDLAREGAGRLNRLLTALPGRSTVALLCHSYGSVVCGLAAPDAPARVTDVAVAGSPGMRLRSAAVLGERRTLWAMRADGDWIADVPHLNFGGLGHGEDPVEPGFGSRRLATGGAAGHSDYFLPGTGSLTNLTAVGTGSYGSVETL
ncbi:alpha/beta hydrolase [Streptomyces durbertensis]|uniref:alpha/beta hydrolase n=1 Tax=Streptomyces durbertensis TaxID=2448886 RepID=UPI002B1FE32A|nr:alpha/beta hydrolase [Streptomyces durbertensis]